MHHHKRGVVKRWVPGAGKQIALTVDDGPSRPWTDQVLAVLAEHDVSATFCMVGRMVSAQPDLARAVVGAGHSVANHTWAHRNLARASPSAIRSEIERTQETITKATGQAPTYFRAPYGAWSREVTDICAREQLRPLGWSVDPQDWARPSTPVIISRLLSATIPGSILLEHDGGGDRSQTVAALRVVIPHLLSEGYRFVRL